MYAKIRKSMWEGSLAGTGETWAVFVYLLANADPKGFVDVHPKVISRMTGFSEAAVAKALGELEAADFSSRTPDAEGRRIVRVDEHRVWGWHITNYEKYRTEKDMGTVREQAAARQRRFRDKNNVTVTLGNAPSRQEEVEVEVEESKSTTSSPDGSGRRAKGVKKQDNPKDREWMETFDEVWWPDYWSLGRKCSKAAAREVWAKIPHGDGQADFDRLSSSFDEAKADWRVTRSEPRFIPHAEKWLRDYLKNLILEA